MKRIPDYIIRVVLSVALSVVFCGLKAQDNKMALSQSEIVGFTTSLQRVSSTISSIESSFSQEKILQMFSKKMVSHGTFRYKREDKLEFLYTSPMKYRMVINGGKMMIDNGGKIQVIGLNNNAVVKEMKALIQASFLGKLHELGDSYSISYFKEKSGTVIVEVIPKIKSVSDMIKKISVTFEPSNYLVSRLILEEASQSETVYYFKNQQINTINNDENFYIK
ncbi:MAG: outer membrane lipoprotein carrier protein LolA [Bacteroidales bacterium]|nr:outer membrane lipoprotein carrier protein LolA [Bacteroidales bacterium]